MLWIDPTPKSHLQAGNYWSGFANIALSGCVLLNAHEYSVFSLCVSAHPKDSEPSSVAVWGFFFFPVKCFFKFFLTWFGGLRTEGAVSNVNPSEADCLRKPGLYKWNLMTWLIDWLRLKLRAAEIVFQESAPEHSQQTHNGTRIQQRQKKIINKSLPGSTLADQLCWMSMTESLMTPAWASLQTDQKTQHNTSNTFTFTHLVLYFVSPFPKERNITVPNWSRLFYVSEIIWGIRFFLITLQGCDAVNCPLLPALGVFYCCIVMRTWVSDCFFPLWTQRTKFKHNRTVFIQDHTQSLLPYNNIQTFYLL